MTVTVLGGTFHKTYEWELLGNGPKKFKKKQVKYSYIL